MKIIVQENSPQKLHLSLKPATIAYTLWGLVFLLCGTITLWLLAGKVHVTANEDGIGYQDRWLGLCTRQAWSLSTEAIQSIELVPINLSIYRSLEVEVQAKDSSRRLAFPFADGPTKEFIVGKLRQAILCGGVPFRYESSGLIPGLILGSLCLAGGIVCLFSIQSVDLVAVSSLGVFTIHRGNLYRRKLAELPIDQLRTLSINAWQVTTAKNNVVSYRVLLQKPNGRPISLTCLPSFDQATAQELVQTTKQWLTLANKATRNNLTLDANHSSIDSAQFEVGIP